MEQGHFQTLATTLAVSGHLRISRGDNISFTAFDHKTEPVCILLND
jgi:hypothetical protein